MAPESPPWDPGVAERFLSMDQVTLGERLRALRLARGFTLQEVAGDLITGAYLSRIENGQRRPSLSVLRHMADVLGVNHFQIIGVSRAEAAEAVANATVAWLRDPHDTDAYVAMTAAAQAWAKQQDDASEPADRPPLGFVPHTWDT